eukprot:m.526619 g.526619  ORF g.526619 m.526619 type:complete len:125 (-) comp57551_c0_seq4:510-884(-)
MSTQADVKQLFDAIQADELSECQQIVGKCGRDIVTTIHEFGWTAMHYAAFNERTAILEWFLSQHMNCNALDGRCTRTLCQYRFVFLSLTLTRHNFWAFDFDRFLCLPVLVLFGFLFTQHLRVSC